MGEETDRILGDIATRRSQAEAEAEAALRDLNRLCGLEYEVERFDPAAANAVWARFLAAHARAAELAAIATELAHRRMSG